MAPYPNRLLQRRPKVVSNFIVEVQDLIPDQIQLDLRLRRGRGLWAILKRNTHFGSALPKYRLGEGSVLRVRDIGRKFHGAVFSRMT
jgi:hypothetical protein